MNPTTRHTPAPTQERTMIGRWESEGGRYWVELYRDQNGYSYDGKGCGGSLGNGVTDDAAAVSWIEQRTAGSAGHFHPGKRPMQRTA